MFFLSLFLAALSSSISILVVCAEHMVDRYGWSHKKSSLVFFVLGWVLAVLCTLSFGPLSNITIAGNSIFGLCDLLASNFFMVIVALAFVIFVGWQLPKPDVYSELTNDGALGFSTKLFPLLYFMIRWILPVVIVFIGISAFL